MQKKKKMTKKKNNAYSHVFIYKCINTYLINSNQSYFYVVAVKCKTWCAYNQLVGICR